MPRIASHRGAWYRNSMLETLKSLFRGEQADAGQSAPDPAKRFRVAAAALMVEAAHLDDSYGDGERDTILRVLTQRFMLSSEEARELLQAAEAAQGEAVQLHGFTKEIKDALEPEERVGIIEMLWEVAYADGHLHDYEAHLVRRVAGLIYVSDVDRGSARKRVLDRLGLEDR